MINRNNLVEKRKEAQSNVRNKMWKKTGRRNMVSKIN